MSLSRWEHERRARVKPGDDAKALAEWAHSKAWLELKDFNPREPRDPHTGKWVDVSADVHSGHDLRAGDLIRNIEHDLRGKATTYNDLRVEHVRNGVAHVRKLRKGKLREPNRPPIAVPELSRDLPGYIANGYAKVFRRQ